jgi:hypothetical protein
VPLMPKVHAHACLVLKLLKFSLYLKLNEKFQYGDLEAPGCLPYTVM